MAKAKKLPSGSWRCQAYSHSEPVTNTEGRVIKDPKTGKPKMRRVYESFTAGSKKEAELLAAQFQVGKNTTIAKGKAKTADMTLSEAIDAYIESRETLDRSPTTLQEYRCTQKYGFQDLMEMKLSEIDETILQYAINAEACRPAARRKNNVPISAKRLKNEWGLISAVLKKYRKDFIFSVELPPTLERVPDLIPAETVLRIIKGTEIELAVLLAAWLSFSMSEIRGLTKSKSISPDGNYIRIAEVMITVNGASVRKDIGKNKYRNRTHRIPPYIKTLIDQVPGDTLVPFTGATIYFRWIKLLNDNHLPHMTFHDLRHLNASVMALLRVPDKYAQERGGWKSDKIMKRVYTQTFAEERERVDNTIDEYFGNIVDGKEQQKKEVSKQIQKVLDNADLDNWQDALLDFIQHEMQHKKIKA